jgi:hypothetical protein
MESASARVVSTMTAVQQAAVVTTAELAGALWLAGLDERTRAIALEKLATPSSILCSAL